MWHYLKPEARLWLPRIGAGLLVIGLIIIAIVQGPPFFDILGHYSKVGKLTGKSAGEARKLYFAALFQPRTPEASGRLGMLLHSQSQVEDALYWYQRAIRLDPRDFAWQYYAGRLELKEANNAQAAIPFLKKATEINDGYVPAKAALAEALRKTGRFEEASSIYIQLVSKNRKASPVWKDWGDALADEGHWSEAVGAYRMAVQISPTAGAAWEGLAKASEKMGDKDTAARANHLAERYRRIPITLADSYMIRLYDDFPTVDSLIADGLRRRRAGAIVPAEESLRRALELDPKRKEAEEDLIAVLAEEGKWSELDKIYKRTVADHADSYGGRYNYALGLMRQTKWEDARAVLEAALKAKPNGAEALNSLGLVEIREGHQDKAEQDFRAAIQANPWLGEAHVNLGSVLYEHHQNAAAEQEFLLALRPESEDPDRRLAQILRRYGASSDRATFLNAARRQAEKDDQSTLLALLRGVPDVVIPRPGVKPAAQPSSSRQ